MSKSPSKSSSSCHDDIAGLFTRLGGSGDSSGYRDFSGARLEEQAARRPPALPRAAAEPGPAAGPAEPAPVQPVVAVTSEEVGAQTATQAKVSLVRIDVPKDVPAMPAQRTPLERLFRRLADADAPAAKEDDSPLRRFRAS